MPPRKNPDFYNLLGVRKDASADELKRAFRTNARRYHPDLNQGDPDAESHMKKVNEAWKALGDPERRKVYDRLGYIPDSGEESPVYADLTKFWVDWYEIGISMVESFAQAFGVPPRRRQS